jgi:hypothetical protein
MELSFSNLFLFCATFLCPNASVGIKTIMKTISTFLLLLITTLGYSQNIEKEVEPFSKILIGPGINIELIKSDVERIQLVSDSKLIHDLKIEVEKGALKIYFDYKNFSFDDNDSPSHSKYSLADTPYEHVKVYGKIYYTRLNSIDFRGENKLFCKENLKSEDFELKIYGESEVKLAEINALTLLVKTYGKNEIKLLGGHVDEMKITTHGENEISSTGLKCDELKITSFGESELEVFANKTLNVKVIGEGSIRYAGDPEVKEFNLGEATISSIH